MKRIIVFALFVLASFAARPMQAQSNPFLGTWKLNLDKSMFPAGQAPKSQTRTVTADGDTVKYSFEGVGADGKPTSYGFSTKYDGKPMPITGNGMPYGADVISIKNAGTGKTTATLEKAGKTVATATAEVSKDGKTLTIVTKGPGADGKPSTIKSVYDKQ
jgi:hypothetical protein